MNETFPPWGRLSPLSLPENREFFLRCYAETWRIAHGDLRGFREEYIYDMYLRRWEREPESLLGLWLGEELTALLALDSSRGEKLLWISFLHVAEHHRRARLCWRPPPGRHAGWGGRSFSSAPPGITRPCGSLSGRASASWGGSKARWSRCSGWGRACGRSEHCVFPPSGKCAYISRPVERFISPTG